MSIGKPVVVGVDNSACALAAAHGAARLAEQLGAPLLLACAAIDPAAGDDDSGPTLMNLPAYLDNLRHQADNTLEQVRGKLRADHPDLPIETARSNDSADVTLVQLSQLARLTVVGTHADVGSGATVIGPTTLRVADHAHGPVVVWRGPAEPENSDAPIVVGVDATPSGAPAIRLAFELASALHAPLTAVHVRHDGTPDEASRALAECLAGPSAEFPDVAVHQVVRDDRPALALAQESEHARLLVVASRVRNPVLATLLGSTSQNLLHHATVPLVIQRG